MKDYRFSVDQIIRLYILLVGMFLLFFAFLKFSVLTPFELSSDYLAYYNFYISGEYRLDRFGFEVVTPVFYFMANKLNVSYYAFVFIFGLAWIPIIVRLSNHVKSIFLVFYFAYFVVVFVGSYAFLFRTYLAALFFFLFMFVGDKKKIIFAFLSIFSQFSGLIFIFFSWLRLRRRSAYMLLAFSAIFVMLLNLSGYNFSKHLLFFLDYTDYFGRDLNRKLNLLNRVDQGNVVSIGWKVLVLLAITVLLHGFFIHNDKQKFSLLRAMFFSAVIVLVFSDFLIMANRFGFLAYFFSVPYFLFVISHFKLNRNFLVTFNGNLMNFGRRHGR